MGIPQEQNATTTNVATTDPNLNWPPLIIAWKVNSRIKSSIKKKPRDFLIEVEDQLIHVHRAILCDASDYCRSMFECGMKESLEGILHIQHARADVIQTLIKYLYGKGISICASEIVDFVDIVGLWDLREVKCHLQCYIEQYAKLQEDECIWWYLFADTYNLNAMKTNVMDFIMPEHGNLQYEYEVFTSDTFQLLGLLQLNQLISDIFGGQYDFEDQNHMVVAACIQWVLRDTSSRKTHISHLLSHISLDRCNPAYLKYVIDTYGRTLGDYLYEEFARIVKSSFLIVTCVRHTIELTAYNMVSCKQKKIEQFTTDDEEATTFCMTDCGLFRLSLTRPRVERNCCLYSTVFKNEFSTDCFLFDCVYLSNRLLCTTVSCYCSRSPWVGPLVGIDNKVFMVGRPKNDNQNSCMNL